jgi:hypothetical protein
MKLESYILRYGTEEDLTAEGHSAEAIHAILALPPEIRGTVTEATPYVNETYSRNGFEKKTYRVDVVTEQGAFVYSRPDGTLVPRHLSQYSTFRFVFWQANIFFRTGYWMEPSTSKSLTVGAWHSPQERAQVVALLATAPLVVPVILIADGLKEKSSAIAAAFSKRTRK